MTAAKTAAKTVAKTAAKTVKVATVAARTGGQGNLGVGSREPNGQVSDRLTNKDPA